MSSGKKAAKEHKKHGKSKGSTPGTEQGAPEEMEQVPTKSALAAHLEELARDEAYPASLGKALYANEVDLALASPSNPYPIGSLAEIHRLIGECRRLGPLSSAGCRPPCAERTTRLSETWRIPKKHAELCNLKLLKHTAQDTAKGARFAAERRKVSRATQFPFTELGILARLASCHIPYLVDVILPAQCSDLRLGRSEVAIVTPELGPELADLVEDADFRLMLHELLALLFSMAFAVWAFHAHGFLHLDISPESFACSADFTSVVLKDFAKATRLLRFGTKVELEARVSADPTVQRDDSGSFPYGRESDVYALGLVMVQLIARESNDLPSTEFSDALESEDIGNRIVDPTKESHPESLEVFLGLALGRYPELADGLTPQVDELIAQIVKMVDPDPAQRGELSQLLNLPVFQRFAKAEGPNAGAVLVNPAPTPPFPWYLPATENQDPLSIMASRGTRPKDYTARVKAFASAKLTGLLLSFDLYHRLVAWFRPGGPMPSDARLAPPGPLQLRHLAIFAIVAISRACPQTDLKDMANLLVQQEEDLLQIFGSLARYSQYIFEDLTILSGVAAPLDALVLLGVALRADYLQIKNRGLGVALAALRGDAKVLASLSPWLLEPLDQGSFLDLSAAQANDFYASASAEISPLVDALSIWAQASP